MTDHDAKRVTDGRAVAEGTLAFVGRAEAARVALVDGAPGLVVAPRGRLRLAVKLVVNDGLITDIDVLADPERLARLDVAVL
jgi:hypothetical protein